MQNVAIAITIILFGTLGYIAGMLASIAGSINKLTILLKDANQISSDNHPHSRTKIDTVIEKINSSRTTILTDMATYHNALAMRIATTHEASAANHATAQRKIDTVFNGVNTTPPGRIPSL